MVMRYAALPSPPAGAPYGRPPDAASASSAWSRASESSVEPSSTKMISKLISLPLFVARRAIRLATAS